MARRITSFPNSTVTPSTTYAYILGRLRRALELYADRLQRFHADCGAIDPREIGVRPTGAYWGAAGEQIDLLAGNLNYSVPLLKAMGRGGWGVNFNLTYNSQNWRQDPAGIRQFGVDVGYGYACEYAEPGRVHKQLGLTRKSFGWRTRQYARASPVLSAERRSAGS